MNSFIIAAQAHPVVNAAYSPSLTSLQALPLSCVVILMYRLLQQVHIHLAVESCSFFNPQQGKKKEKKELIFQHCTSISQPGLSPKECWQSKTAEDIRVAPTRLLHYPHPGHNVVYYS